VPEPAWWQRGAIYQIYPRSFSDSDGDGDGVGDLRGIGAHLDHLADLGVEAVWLEWDARSQGCWSEVWLGWAGPGASTNAPRSGICTLSYRTDPNRGDDVDVDLNGFQFGPSEAALLRIQELR
jgi:hypothetical protein